MEEINEKEFDFSLVFKKILPHWKMILLWCFVGALAGFGISKSIPSSYTVVSKVSPELSYRSNSLNSFAALAGISNYMLNSNDALLPTVYPDIIKSPDFVIKLLETEVNAAEADTTYYGYLTTYCKAPWWNAVIALPFKAVSAVKGWFVKEPESDSTDVFNNFRLTKEQAAVIKRASQNISVMVDKKTYMITISVKAQDPVVAAQVSQAVLSSLKEFVSEYRTGKAKMDMEYFGEMKVQAEEEYLNAQRKLSRYVDSNQGMVFQSSRVYQQQLQNDANLKYQLYSTMSQQYQNSKAKVQQETPVFVEIVSPSVPVRRSSPSTMKNILIFAFLGGLISCVVFYFKGNFKESIKKWIA